MDDERTLTHEPPVPDVPTRLTQALAERTPGHGHLGCDAFSPCASCQTARAAAIALAALDASSRRAEAS